MEFKQFRIFGGFRKYELIDDKQLKTTFSRLSGKNIEIIDLYKLDNKYERIIYREIKWIPVALITGMVTFKFVLDAIKIPDPFPIGVALFFASMTAILFINYFINHHDQFVFRVYQSSEPALLIWATKPNEKKAKEFSENLVSVIDKIKVNPNLSFDKKLEIYTDSLSFLCDEGVILQNEFDQILERTRKKLEKSNKGSIISIAK